MNPSAAPAANAETPETVQAEAIAFRACFARLRDEIGKLVVGQADVLHGLLVALFAGGHVLLEGVPGLGKTLLVRTLAEAAELDFSRIQFTPDLMPADIIGTDLITEDEATGRRRFQFQPGPLLAHIVLADEINRATPKTQSALLEAMQERQITVGGVRHLLPDPFLVLATQNPLEMEGTYPLPEAQLDRFLFKLRVPYPSAADLHAIIERTTGPRPPAVAKAITRDEILRFRQFARSVPIAHEIQDTAVHLILATQPHLAPPASPIRKYVLYGSSPRGLQAIILAAKIHALLDGRHHVARQDLRLAALPSLRHRLILTFEATADNITADQILEELIRTEG